MAGAGVPGARLWQGDARGDPRVRVRSARAQVATTEAFLDNVASNGVSRSLGYQENGFGSLAPEGVARETRRFRLTAKEWHAQPRPAIKVDGLAACRELFGAARPAKSEKPATEAARKR